MKIDTISNKTKTTMNSTNGNCNNASMAITIWMATNAINKSKVTNDVKTAKKKNSAVRNNERMSQTMPACKYVQDEENNVDSGEDRRI